MKTKYLVLSDLGKNRRYRYMTDARRDHDKRCARGEDGVEIWREYPAFDWLLVREGKDVRLRHIKSVYQFFKEAV